MTPLPGVILRVQATKDVITTLDYLAENNPRKAAQFARCARETLLRLVEAPFIGSPRDLSDIDPQLHSLRAWPVSEFKQYLIYYRAFASGNGIEVWGLVHSSRDIISHLKEALEP